ncbi:MAG: M20/M25/M40 family metallo-hydrolase, partial [Gammaproteobacteria bacterium]
MDAWRNTSAGLLLAALLAAAWCALALPPAAPPPAVPDTAEAAAFSAERARLHLRELTREPRPVGSPGHAQAREYLLDALRALGLAPELHRATGLRRHGDTLRAAAVANIVARLPGTDSSAAVVLMSHYDSVPNAPGAADAGHGVAAILETLRALSSGPPLRNDLIVLFTDAEEAGLLGAQAYVDEHPWAEETGIVLNAEGRGHTGPVQMFRTTADNGRMIRTLARAAPYPAAESLANEIFRLMPNDTDLTVFQRAGYAGMDFANAHGLTHYHTPLDNFDNADPRTLQHHGSYLLSLARAFGAMDLTALAAPDRIYFALPVIGLVHYPLAWAPALA